MLLSLAQGKLVLLNTEDGTEHVFQLSGTAEKPLALEHIVLKSQVHKAWVAHYKPVLECIQTLLSLPDICLQFYVLIKLSQHIQ